MSFTEEQFQKIQSGSEEKRVEALRQLLNYPLKERDPEGSNFWFIRAGEDEEEAEDTSPIAVGFNAGLNERSEKEVKQFLTLSEQDQTIRGHYLERIGENQPVMYLLFPTQQSGRVAFILPSEGQLRQRSIQTFGWDDPELTNRLTKLQQESLEIAKKFLEGTLNRTLQLDWVFYESAKTAQELAQKLAEVARKIEQAIPNVYESEGEHGYLHKLLESFQKELLSNLKPTSDNQEDYSFADIYAQTIAYGLFTARVFSYVKEPKKDFNRRDVGEKLPETNPFLRQLFGDISARSPEELGDELIDAISETFAILRAAQMDTILADFRNKMNREDIIIRFYEDFLAAYKPEMREKRGVYYTPEPVVSYMVRSVDELIKDKFDKPLGIADPEVMILDPACGTGTFLLWIFQLIHQRFQENPKALTEGLEDKSWSGYVTERLLPRIFGFELLMAPYAIAHLKLGLFLEETGYQFESGKRLGVYLINTLEDIKLREEQDQLSLQLPQLEEIISEEAKEGSKVKKNEPIMVVIGNPPYSGHSQNDNEWIKTLVNDYYYIDGSPMGERNSKWLRNDYVKFIRFAQWKIDKNSNGILAFITSNSFLDSRIHRGMRQQLLSKFEQIFIFNLHGNTQFKNSSDQNIFDIEEGNSISIFIKDKNKSSFTFYSDLIGYRQYKYDTLLSKNINNLNYKKINPRQNYYFLVPQSSTQKIKDEYEKYYHIDNIFIKKNIGVITGKDKIVIEFDKKQLINKVKTHISDYENSIFNGNENQYIHEYFYRPFDKRYIFYSKQLLERDRFEIMKNLIYINNFAFHLCKQNFQQGWRHILSTNCVTDDCYVSNKSRERGYTIPLYLYSDSYTNNSKYPIYDHNLKQSFLKAIQQNHDNQIITSESIFYYIYSILHSPNYRIRYAEFLKYDFPRIPITKNNYLFLKLSEYGKELVQLHLMTSPKLDELITEFVDNGGSGEIGIGTAKTAYNNGVVKLNRQGDCFTGVPEEVWNFYIGGYQVCHKWLKDRKGRTLSDEDILHYQKIIVSIKETIRLMQLIDQAIPGFPIE